MTPMSKDNNIEMHSYDKRRLKSDYFTVNQQ